MTLTMCIGLIASGKTTWAKEQVIIDSNIIRVNKDDIRAELVKTGWTWSQENEKRVITIRDSRIAKALETGHDVISDDTNLAYAHQKRLRELALTHGAAFVEKHFEVTVEEAIRRDALREAPIGEVAIRRMAAQYMTSPVTPYTHTDGLPTVVICDLDGTAALMTDRGPYEGEKCASDAPNEPVRTVLRCLLDDQHGCGAIDTVVYLSGRDDCYKDLTQAWLIRHAFPEGPLFMRRTGDRRKDTIIKGELFDAHIRGQFNVLLVLDDRTSVVNYWRSLGLPTWQVAPGDF